MLFKNYYQSNNEYCIVSSEQVDKPTSIVHNKIERLSPNQVVAKNKSWFLVLHFFLQYCYARTCKYEKSSLYHLHNITCRLLRIKNLYMKKQLILINLNFCIGHLDNYGIYSILRLRYSR